MSNKKLSKPFRFNQNSEIRRDFYKRLLYIGICIIPIIIFADNKDEFRLVPLPFFLFAMYQLLQIIALSQLIIDDFFPPKIVSERKTKPFDKFVYYFSNTLFFVGLLSQIFEIRKFDNTINGTKLFWIAGCVGITFAIILTVILKTKFPSVYYESKRRYTVHFGLFIGLFLFTSASTGFVNHSFSDGIKTYKNYKIQRKGKSGGRTTEYFIYLSINNNDERFSIGKTRYDRFKEGDEIELCTIKGKFGFEYVTEFNKLY
ncbi:hypothetical protein [Flavobacterium taihuense]|uniref:Uncharacterized protein n=1 Tax=Flavobacterium taihuense TaxID=2857508 RepID=A0ABS6Y1C4_9FLAO|nr:hypothetical protein [Flavobacterium taihuense]MBW4362742.1 hypothetical protein [Flavobacterium taihuense]